MIILLESNLFLLVTGLGVAHLGPLGNSAASTSPVRKPLLKFCNRPSKDAIIFVFTNLYRNEIRNLIFRLQNSDEGSPLRSEVASHPGELIRANFGNGMNGSLNGFVAYYIAAIMNSVFGKFRSDWLKNIPSLMASFMSHCQSPNRLAKLARAVHTLEENRGNLIIVES